LLGFQSHVHEYGEAGVEFSAESVEEPIVGGELACVFVFDAHE
jgi:hypothetical protein